MAIVATIALALSCGRLGYETVSAAGAGGAGGADRDGGAGQPGRAGGSGAPGGASGSAGSQGTAGSFDAGVPPDAASVDAAPASGKASRLCTPGLQGALALYRLDAFPDGVATDSRGNHDGRIEGAFSDIDGPLSPCRKALVLEQQGAHVEVPDHPDWQLDQGSVDLWVKHDGAAIDRALLSRDGEGSAEDGHFAMLVLKSGRVVVRIQRRGNAPNVVFLCSQAPMPASTWTHIGVNFGSPEAELYINGQRSMATDSVGVQAQLAIGQCGTNADVGIAGNGEPWLIGASRHGGDAPAYSAVGLGIDSVRISRVRRDFSDFF